MANRSEQLINSFNSGELSPLMLAQVNFPKYKNGCEIIENWNPLPQGGVETVDGTRFVKEVKDSTKPAILIPFIVGTTVAYMLEFGDLYFRVYLANGVRVEVASVPVEVVTVYPATALFGIKLAQDANNLYLTHPTIPTQVITRTSDTVWAIAAFASKDGPFLDENIVRSLRISVAGGELITNGPFTGSLTGWANVSTGTGTAVYNGGTGRADLTQGPGAGDSGALRQQLSVLTYREYTVMLDVFTNNIVIFWGPYPDGTGNITSGAIVPGVGKTFVLTGGDDQYYLVIKSTTLNTTASIDNVTITAALMTGAAVTLTASQALFLAGHEGSKWKLRDLHGLPSEGAWKTGTAYVKTNRVVNGGQVYECVVAGTSGVLPPVHLTDAISDGGVTWTWVNDGTGSVEITGYNSATVVTGIVRAHLPANVTSPSRFWSEGAWSTVQGFPRGVSFDQQRLMFCGTTGSPATVWGSELNFSIGFKAGVLANSAVIFTVQSNQVNALLWMIRGHYLFTGTNGGEYTLNGEGGQVITATNPPLVQEIGAYGSADVQPVKVGQNVIMVQRGGRVLREIVFNNLSQSVLGPEDVTILSEHITTSGVKQLAYQQAPNPTVLALLNSGTLATLTYFPKEEVKAWARRVTAGTIEAVAAMPISTGDQIWIIVNRMISSVTKRYIEYYDPTIVTHSTVSVANPPTVPITNAAHLIGKTVSLIADGELQGSQIVLNAGTVTPTATCAVLDIGLPVVPTLTTVRPEVSTGDGSIQGRKQRWVSLRARVYKTRNLTINGQLHTLPSPLISGDIPVSNLGYDRDGRITVTHTDTRKARLLGFFGVLDSGDA